MVFSKCSHIDMTAYVLGYAYNEHMAPTSHEKIFVINLNAKIRLRSV